MSKVIVIGLAAALLGAASASDAAITVSSTPFASFDAAAQHVIIDFDAPLASGFTITGGLQRTANDSLGAQPAIAPNVKGTSRYWSINPGNPGTLQSTTGGYRQVSFLWGSMDKYNTLTLLGAGGSVLGSWTGAQVYQPSNGDQFGSGTNRRVMFTSSANLIHGIRLNSTQPAFEIDDVAFAQPVPEPATWAMMILGFGAIGGSLRSRRRMSALA